MRNKLKVALFFVIAASVSVAIFALVPLHVDETPAYRNKITSPVVLTSVRKNTTSRFQDRASYCAQTIQDSLNQDGYLGPYVLLRGDASTSTVVNWVAPDPDGLRLRYRERGSRAWNQQTIDRWPLPNTNNYVFSVNLNSLRPDTVYEYSISKREASDHARIRHFRTAPRQLQDELVFVAGGDMLQVREYMEATTKVAASLNPRFAALGGDLAYDDGRHTGCWYDWLRIWARYAVTPDGIDIPIVTAIGNHETQNPDTERHDQTQTPQQAPFYYALFRRNLPSNYVVDFSNYLSIVVLDSGHTQAIPDQTPWLDRTLNERGHIASIFALYHVPAYGILKGGLGNKLSSDIRRLWVPLFENAAISAAFENHHHIYKRSKLIFRGKVDDRNGVLYIGDGAWGTIPRKLPEPLPDSIESLWYVERAHRRQHFLKVTLGDNKRLFEAIDSDGERFDSFLDRRRRRH